MGERNDLIERRWIGVVPSGLQGPAKVTRLERVAEIWRDRGLFVTEWVPATTIASLSEALVEAEKKGAEVKAWLLGDPATGQWVEVDGCRVEYSRGVGTPIVALAEAFKAQRERAYAAERERNIAHSERDNAVKALETVEDILIRFIAAIDDVWSDAAEDVDLPLLRKLADVGRAQFAAHSASSPAPPHNSSQGGQHG